MKKLIRKIKRLLGITPKYRPMPEEVKKAFNEVVKGFEDKSKLF